MREEKDSHGRSQRSRQDLACSSCSFSSSSFSSSLKRVSPNVSPRASLTSSSSSAASSSLSREDMNFLATRRKEEERKGPEGGGERFVASSSINPCAANSQSQSLSQHRDFPLHSSSLSSSSSSLSSSSSMDGENKGSSSVLLSPEKHALILSQRRNSFMRSCEEESSKRMGEKIKESRLSERKKEEESEDFEENDKENRSPLYHTDTVEEKMKKEKETVGGGGKEEGFEVVVKRAHEVKKGHVGAGEEKACLAESCRGRRVEKTIFKEDRNEERRKTIDNIYQGEEEEEDKKNKEEEDIPFANQENDENLSLSKTSQSSRVSPLFPSSSSSCCSTQSPPSRHTFSQLSLPSLQSSTQSSPFSPQPPSSSSSSSPCCCSSSSSFSIGTTTTISSSSSLVSLSSSSSASSSSLSSAGETIDSRSSSSSPSSLFLSPTALLDRIASATERGKLLLFKTSRKKKEREKEKENEPEDQQIHKKKEIDGVLVISDMQKEPQDLRKKEEEERSVHLHDMRRDKTMENLSIESFSSLYSPHVLSSSPPPSETSLSSVSYAVAPLPSSSSCGDTSDTSHIPDIEDIVDLLEEPGNLSSSSSFLPPSYPSHSRPSESSSSSAPSLSSSSSLLSSSHSVYPPSREREKEREDRHPEMLIHSTEEGDPRDEEWFFPLQAKPLPSVTDFSSQLWCENQLRFTLQTGFKRETLAMKKGTVRHLALELHYNVIEEVLVETEEEAMAFKLLNSISQLQQLYERGVCRELWVFGEVCRGVMVRGVIDELRIVKEKRNKKKMKKKTRSLFPGSIKDERDHRIPGRIRTEAIPFSSSSSFACSARSEGEEGQRTETSSSSTCAFDLIEIPDWEEEQRQEEEEEEVNDVSWKGKEKENKKMSRRWRAPWMFSSPGGNSVPERDLKGRRPSTSLQGPCERMKEKGRGRSSPFAESQGRGDVDSEEEEERFFVLLSDNKTRSVKKTPGLSQKQTSALQLQIYWYLLDRLRHEPIPTDSFFSAFKLDPRAELTNPLLLTAAQAANVPLMAPRGVRTPKEDEEKMKKKQSGRVDTRDGSTPTMDVEMTVSEEDAESMKNDMAVVYMKGETTEEEKEKEDEEEVVDLTGDNELDTIKCSQEDLNVSLGKETRRKEEEEEEAGGEKRSQVLRLDALLKKFQEAWRQLPNLWREIHVVYECEGEEFAREKIPYHGETVEYSLQDLTSWWKGHRPAETLQSSEKWKCRSCPFLAQCKATPLDDQERKAALIEQEQADEENKRALEEFDETLALQQEQQRLEDLLRQKWQQSRRNQKAQTDSYTGADSRAEALHLSERNTRRNESSQAVNERTMTDKYQSVCDPSRGNRTHIQSDSHIFQNTEITSTEISSDKTRGTSDSCSVVSPVSRLTTGSVSKIQVEPSQSCSHVNTEHIGEVACYESKTHSSLSTPSYSRHTGLISNDVGKVVVGKELMGSRHLTQQRTVIMHSHQSRSGGGGQWVMTGRPCERDGLKSDVSSEPGLGYLNRGPASSRKRRFAGLFTTRDEQAPSKHKSQEIQGNARADSQAPRAFPGESTKERLAESKNMTGPLPVPGTGGPKSVAGFAPCGDETQHPSEHRRSKGQDSLQDCLADAGAAGNQKKGHECLMADLYTRSSAAHEKDDLCLLVSKGQQRTGSRQQQNGSAVNCSAHGPEHPKARIARTAVTSACTAEQAGREGAFTAEPCPVIGVSEACRRRSSSRFESFCSVSDPDTPQQAATNVTPAKRSNELLASRVSRSKERSNGHLLAQAQLPGKPEAGAEPGGTQNGVGKGVNCRVQEEKHGRSRGIRRGVQTKRQQSSGAKSSATFLGQCQITKYFKKP